MATKYLVQHRRGTAAQWAEQDTLIPREGEIVIEIDEVNSLHKLKIGDGVHTYAELAYLKAGDEIVTQVLAEAKPRVITVELSGSWAQDSDDKYYQTLALEGITARSRLDLQPDANMLAEFKQLGLVFVTENNSGVITVYSVGNMPQKAYTMQATIVETECNGQNAVVGIPVGASAAQSDWTQTDDTKSDYIKNKPTLGTLASKSEVAKTDLATDVQASLNKADTALQSFTETDPTVPSWAKAASKPSYAYSEITDKPIIPSSVSEVAHQYAISNSRDNISDVETWTKITSSLSQRERSCIFANGYYVVCGVGGEVGYSEDGITWTKITPFVSGTLTNIAYGKGKFIIVDEFGSLWLAEETPISWTKIDVTFSSGIGSLAYANGRFVIAGDYMCAFSEDGIKWTEVEAPNEHNQIAFGGGRYVAVGANGAVSVSYDGITWVDRSNPAVTGDLRAVVYAKGKYIIGGIDGLIMYTEDFVTWNIATSNSAGVRYVRQIVYAENRYYAACYTSSGTGEIWVSNDGETWTVQQQMNVRLWCLNYNDGKLVTAGDGGSVYASDLGIVWLTKQPELTSGQYLWERIVFTLSDGDQVIGDSVCVKEYSLSSYTETDPTVPAWAKEANKPTYTASEVGAEASGTVSTHNTATTSHNDIRDLITGLTTRLNALADSDDTTLDQMSEIVAYIKSNKSLIEEVTTNKVNVSDIINNLTTNVSNKPLSAAQGVALKELIDGLEIPTIPPSLPANGGDADTVDGKHAEDFATASSVKSLSSEIANLKADIGNINSILDSINGEVI